MNVGDIVVRKKKGHVIVKWAKAVVDADDVLSMATTFLARLPELKREQAGLTKEIADLGEAKARLANEFHAQQTKHASVRDEFGPEISRMRAEVHAERVKTQAQMGGFAGQLAAAQEKHNENLAELSAELLQVEGLLGAATDKYNAFKKELMSHG